MPSGIPKLGDGSTLQTVGELKAKGPALTAWTDTDTKALIELEEGPPPWEIAGTKDSTSAKQFVDYPDTWELRWINPRLLDQSGWRGWQHVRAADPRVTIKVRSMVSPEGMIRRGHMGDILAYMPKHWYEIRVAERNRRTARQTQSSVDQTAELKESVNAGRFGPHVRVTQATHPTHTIADPADMRNAD